jgi:hypothetical protein
MYFMHFICSRVYSFTGSGSYPFTCFIRSFIHPFFCSFVCSVILSFIRSFIIYFCKRFLFAMLCHFGGMSTLFHLTTSTFVASASRRYSYRLLISDRLSSFSKLPPRSGRTQSGIFCSWCRCYVWKNCAFSTSTNVDRGLDWRRSANALNGVLRNAFEKLVSAFVCQASPLWIRHLHSGCHPSGIMINIAQANCAAGCHFSSIVSSLGRVLVFSIGSTQSWSPGM